MKRFALVLLIAVQFCFATLVCAQGDLPALAKLKAAAENGDLKAQIALGDTYRGRLDSGNALMWYRKAAERGDAHSQSEAGIILVGFANAPTAKPEVRREHGAEAIQLLTQAANQGEQAAQLYLGRQFESGKWIKADRVEAYKWFVLAARNGNPMVPKELEAKWARDALILKMSQEEIAEGQKRVKAFTPRKVSSEEMPEPYWVQDIKLQGVSGAEPRRLAIINGQTFQKGDQAEIKVAGKKVKITCQDVREDSVLVMIEGIAAPRELKLPAAESRK